jgi:hypothetical protein
MIQATGFNAKGKDAKTQKGKNFAGLGLSELADGA